MKRRSIGTPLRTCLFFSHPFVGRYAFVERLFRTYLATYQTVIYPYQQFNAFSPLNKSAGEATKVSIAISRLVGRTSVLPTNKGKPMLLAKRKRRPTAADITADTSAGFWEQKAIAH
ncbi:hypothetical protein [Bacteroides sp. ET225]|uniref:hypothetical protein n=1 Tax=Bacteroides sp. ET225 TaxID=2972461 RepID=UPI0021ACAD3A|nr:hypothetical protein [Bacteroides sp. ET225]MCR8918252.1 hypothetical protein [Bacteroides sp. ET225]